MGWSRYALGEGAALAVVLSALIRLPRWRKRTDLKISPAVLGYLTGGTRRAVRAAIAELHVRGAVRLGRPGTVKHAGGKFARTDPLLSAVYAAIYQPTGPRVVASRPQVRRAVGQVRKELVAARLWLPTGNWVASRILLVAALPLLVAQFASTRDATGITLVAIVFVLGVLLALLGRRTWTCRSRTRQLGREGGRDAESVGYAVAVRGKRALREIMPRFAKEGGLLDGGTSVPYLGDGSIEANGYTAWGS